MPAGSRARGITWRFLAATLLFLSGALLSTAAAKDPQLGGIYRAPLRLSPTSLDPARTESIYAVEVIQQLFDGLVEYDADLQIRPALAEGWRVSLDGRIYTFRLREGARFHNGRAVTAADVVYSVTRVLLPETRSNVAPLFAVIEGAADVRAGKTAAVRGLKTLGPLEVEIRLTEPYAPFLALLATRGAKVVPKEAVEAGGTFGLRPVGTGPFRFVRWDPGGEIVLEANPDYFAGRPHFSQLVYRIQADKTDVETFEEFRRGELEHAPLPASPPAESETGRGAYQLRRRPLLAIRFYGFQLRLPQWKDPRVRAALTAALNPLALVPDGSGSSVPTRGVLPPGLPGYEPADILLPPDPTRAARLLADAGHRGGKGLPPIAVWSPVRGVTTETEIAEMARAWGPLGLTVSPKFAPDWPGYTQMLSEGRLPVFRYGWHADIPDPDNVLGILFHSRSAYNYTGYANPEVDRLLERARREPDPVARARMYARIEQRILADTPIIPIAHLWFEVAYQPYVRGVEVSALGAPYIPMRKVWLDRP